MKVLILHGLRFDSRLTTFHHTLSFARHLTGCEVTYVNGQGLIDDALLGEKFDLAIVTYELIALRNTPFWRYIERRIRPLLQSAGTRVVMPQDDYSSCEMLDSFVVQNDIQYVFSPLTRDLHMLYPRSIEKGVNFHEALTGYWEASTTVPYSQFRRPFKERSKDLGQRVRHLPPQLGAGAQRKGELAISFASAAEDAGFSCDVSTNDSDVLVGLDWWKFLGDIRFTVGRLGGASIADPKGDLAMKVHQLQLRKPGITYEEISRRLKTESLPQGNFSAISPRLFECAAMGVCQILERDNYFDDFEPWTHYIPLESDMSNLSEVFSAMRDEMRCTEIVARAEETLITSDQYSYRTFVRHLFTTCMGFELPEDGEIFLKDNDAKLFGGHPNEDIDAIQEEVRQAIIRKRLRRATKTTDKALLWITNFEEGCLMLESLTLPWCSAIQNVSST